MTSHSISPQLPDPGTALGPRAFWGVFAAAWFAYLGLYVSLVTLERDASFSTACAMGLVGVGPAALLSVGVALRRRDLLRPERSLQKTVGVHLAVGFAYTVSAAVIAYVLYGLFGWADPVAAELSREAAAAAQVVNGVFLYIILAGYMMWSESLERVHESRTLAAREAMLRAQAEAKTLRAQFNPHFVFNTLHSLMLLVRADPAAAERAIEDVATLIRYASILQRRGVDTVPLFKELAVARRYVALEGLRLEDRLRVSWEVEDGLDDVGVPAFAVQTLVENAIKHGLEPRPAGGLVAITAERAEGGLLLRVEDDGEGAEPAAVVSAEGHGLQLLEARLRALYGGEASVRWRTAPGDGFTAEVRLPERPAGAAHDLAAIAPVPGPRVGQPA